MTYRTQLSLDGDWNFQIDPDNHDHWQAITTWRTATVPLPWQAQFDDLRHYSGVAWYQRNFTLNAIPSGAAILHFGAVDYHALIWVNGQPVGEHEGGYLPFEFDIAVYVQPGQNQVVVKVIDPDDNPERFPAYPFSQIPHGKQSWYGPISGLWQSVWLELRPAHHLQWLRLTPNVQTGQIACQLQLTNSANPATMQLRLEVKDPTGKVVAQQTLPAGAAGQVQLDPAAIALWSPDAPNLYTVTATLEVDGHSIDQLSQTCGFRTIEARAGRIYLNGTPIYLRGVLDQAYYPETIYTPPSLEFLEGQLLKAKSLGLNCLRCHIKIEDPRYYEVADRLGMLIWTEIPNWIHLTPQASERVKETFKRMIERDWNHPSIFAWTLVNENWGTDLVHNAAHRRWLADFTNEAKQLDPTRLIVDNSACCDNFHVAGDIDDFHHYRAIPDHADDWDEWVADVANRAGWMWADDYAHNRRAGLPLIVSEFGNWGLPNPANIREHGREPWWFETGFERSDGIVYPHGFRQRFEYWQLDQVFGSFEAFTAAHQHHLARSLAYEIATMRLYPTIAGYVITEFTDVHWECNGLLDMRRNIKQHLDDFTAINQDRALVIRPQRWSGRPAETIPIDLLAFEVDGAGQNGTIQWQAGAMTGTITAPGQTINLTLPEGEGAGLLTLSAQWRAVDATILAHSQVEIAWAAPVVSGQKLHVLDNNRLAQTLKQLGYNVTDDANDKEAILIAQTLPANLRQTVQQGQKVLLLLGPEATQITGLGSIVTRKESPWQGDWATSFSWLKKTGPFANLPGNSLLDLPYAAIMPDAVIANLPAGVLRERSWAGLALGWLHKPVSLLVDISYGQGHIIITTFTLTADTLTNNVLAQNLFSGLLNLCVTSR